MKLYTHWPVIDIQSLEFLPFLPGGPNCLLTAEYRSDIETAAFRLDAAIPMIPTRPPGRAPSAAPNLLLGSYKTGEIGVKGEVYRTFCLSDSSELHLTI